MPKLSYETTNLHECLVTIVYITISLKTKAKRYTVCKNVIIIQWKIHLNNSKLSQHVLNSVKLSSSKRPVFIFSGMTDFIHRLAWDIGEMSYVAKRKIAT